MPNVARRLGLERREGVGWSGPELWSGQVRSGIGRWAMVFFPPPVPTEARCLFFYVKLSYGVSFAANIEHAIRKSKKVAQSSVAWAWEEG
jgi:hypothetical protein